MIRLTRQERAAFFADHRPNLTRDKQPDCGKGDLYVLSWARPKPYSQPAWCRGCNSQLPPNSQGKPKEFCDYCGSEAVEQAQRFRSHREPLYWLRITKVTRRARGDWQIHYELVDRRNPKRWLRPAPPARVVKQDEVGSVWEAEVRAAAEHSAYQTTARGALDKPEAISAETQEGFSAAAEEWGIAKREWLCKMREEAKSLPRRKRQELLWRIDAVIKCLPEEIEEAA